MSPISVPNHDDPQYMAWQKSRRWMPPSFLDENQPNRTMSNVACVLTSGTLRLSGGLVVPANATVATLTACSSTATTGQTNTWLCLVRAADLLVLGFTADELTVPWAANTPITRNLTSTFTPTVDTAVYVGCLVAASGAGSLIGGGNGVNNLQQLAPSMGGNSTTALTTPGSCPATVGATSAVAGNFWAAIGS